MQIILLQANISSELQMHTVVKRYRDQYFAGKQVNINPISPLDLLYKPD